VRLGDVVRVFTASVGDVVRQRVEEGDRTAALLEIRW
jgi:hypothetical protein